MECFSDVKGISKPQVAVTNTDGVLRIWHNHLNMVCQYSCLACQNAVSNIGETSLQIGDFVKVVSGKAFKAYTVVTKLRYGDAIEINYLEMRDRCFVIAKII